MSVPFYKAIPGRFVVEGKEPDGDSVRFVAHNPDDYQDLFRAFRIRPSRTDRSVQLRFEAVDTPEVHYGKFAQPLGEQVRDKMLEQLGFTSVTYGGGSGNQVVSSTPASIPGLILTKGVDANGRPVCYVLNEQETAAAEENGLQLSDWNFVGLDLLPRTLNWFLLQEGLAYYTVYTSTPLLHRRSLKPVARLARQNGSGLWSTDDTASFVLEDQESIGPGGNLILPKLFRRCTDYLRAVGKGFQGELTDWLRANSSGARAENDLVLLDGVQGPVPFSALIDQRNREITLEVDLLSMTFVEK